MFVSDGTAVDAGDHLAPAAVRDRLISEHSLLRPFHEMARQMDPAMLAATLIGLSGARAVEPGVWMLAAVDNARLEQLDEGALRLRHDAGTITLRRVDPAEAFPLPVKGWTVHPVERAEMERMLTCGIRRLTEVAMPGPTLSPAALTLREVAHGRLRVIDGMPVAQLWGSPEQMGRAHGELLARQVERCLDSILLAGCAATVMEGEWFLDRLRSAYDRLEPFIPPDHLTEMDALADAAGIPRDTMRLGSVFPELFHCSGFAIFGSATADGELYHGRVLDYMTQIGLQHAAVVFVVRPDDGYAFLNVGYAGFIGSVTGMNEHGLGLGEMGGAGEGDWDGVPMATLIRRGVQQCATLDELIRLFTDSPRTCEYYYVFSDAKIPDAVGVHATPDRITIVRAGESHPRLGPGIPDTVVLSSGDRLMHLRDRVTAGLGSFSAPDACHLMDRPVAMRSNLHNVLMVPGKAVAYVAHASDRRIAAERPYVTIDFAALLAEIPAASMAR